jgi:poly(3-hydroxybutyrate) depolymerase
MTTKLKFAGMLALASGIALASCTPAKPAATLSASESWCPDGFEVGPQDTCFAVPETTTKDTPVLVYLHGMYSGHGSAEEWSLVRSAVDRGFAVVVPRGKRGLCAWKAEVKDNFCWPQETEDPQAFKNVVAEWERVLWQVDAILETGSHKRYVLGFSNGGFFATYIAEHGLFNADAYAIVGGGPLGPPAKPAKAAPVMLIRAQDDAAQGPKLKELHDQLNRAGWAHAFCTRPGPHPLAAPDLAAALTFFKREHDGLLAQSGPYACEGGTSSVEPMMADPGGASAAPPGAPPGEKSAPTKKASKKHSKAER